MATQYYTATSVDGFIADADNSLDWLFQFDEGDESPYPDFIAEVGALVMGATTYRWIHAHHLDAGADRPQPWPYRQPCWVFSHRPLPAVPDAELHFVSGDIAAAHAEIAEAAGGKNIWLVGGGDLVGQFHDHGLLDEIILGVAPVTLGSGAPVLPRAIVDPPLELIGVDSVAGTFAYLRYRVGGRPAT
ncbi:dihydrofolate reductase family protein [Microlunatus soli]|uniref:Dihydrofolate reductase n=1 Tax=Microlunatus soli TaxID=630515 RepID=A0A1H1UQT2_9ACTN|nr:dihydrofolate reductase family protein [Microlunatus soli]SDS74219.1 Dihydrofolate reductase [Microlunatus soli]